MNSIWKITKNDWMLSPFFQLNSKNWLIEVWKKCYNSENKLIIKYNFSILNKNTQNSDNLDTKSILSYLNLSYQNLRISKQF